MHMDYYYFGGNYDTGSDYIKDIKTTVILFILIIILDFIWYRLIKKDDDHIKPPCKKILGIMLALMLLGISLAKYFATSSGRAFLYGMITGLIIYLIYNILCNTWSILDIIYGMLSLGFTAWVIYKIK